jgi:NTE family protein
MAMRGKLGLALGAGAARGWAHVGVVQRLEELGLTPDVVAGCSSGAFVGAFVAAGRLARVREIAVEMSWLKTLRMLDLQPAHGGLIQGEQVGTALNDALGDIAIGDLAKPFGVSTTELATGRERWLTEGPLAPAVRASMAVPGFMAPQLVDGRRLMDGALTNPVPVSVAKALGADVVIAVALGGELSLNLAPATEEPAKARVAADHLVQAMGLHGTFPADGEAEDPGVFDVISAAMIIVQNFVTRIRLAAEPADLLLIPDVGGVGLHEFHRADEAIQAGRDAVDEAVAELRRLTG